MDGMCGVVLVSVRTVGYYPGFFKQGLTQALTQDHTCTVSSSSVPFAEHFALLEFLMRR